MEFLLLTVVPMRVVLIPLGLSKKSIGIPEEITKITGITQEMVQGKLIDPADVEKFAADADLIIAHNAGFDRKFLEKFAPAFERKPWACSMAQIPWKEEGLMEPGFHT